MRLPVTYICEFVCGKKAVDIDGIFYMCSSYFVPVAAAVWQEGMDIWLRPWMPDCPVCVVIMRRAYHSSNESYRMFKHPEKRIIHKAAKCLRGLYSHGVSNSCLGNEIRNNLRKLCADI